MRRKLAALVAVVTVAAGVVLADDHGQWQSMDTGVKFARQNPHPIESPAAAPAPSPAWKPATSWHWLTSLFGR
jgi:hypothetical protein